MAALGLEVGDVHAGLRKEVRLADLLRPYVEGHLREELIHRLKPFHPLAHLSGDGHIFSALDGRDEALREIILHELLTKEEVFAEILIAELLDIGHHSRARLWPPQVPPEQPVAFLIGPFRQRRIRRGSILEVVVVDLQESLAQSI